MAGPASNTANIFTTEWMPAPASLDPGDAVYAIGDVHGRLDLLQGLVGYLQDHVFVADGVRRRLVTLGDYVDRGPRGVGVLVYLRGLKLEGAELHTLKGNHEEYLEAFLSTEGIAPSFIRLWLNNGGRQTLAELGIDGDDLADGAPEAVRKLARERMPAEALEQLERLKPYVRIGPYLFVHAGVEPDVPFTGDARGLTTIREPFLRAWGWIHDFVVVHGHTICGPDVLPHRIAVDSGAWFTGILTGVELQGDRLRFIAATLDDDLGKLDRVPFRQIPARGAWSRVQPRSVSDRARQL